MGNEAVLMALIVLIIVLVFVIPMVLSKKKEGFDTGISAFDSYSKNPSGYNDAGAKKYNPFASIQDVTVRNYAKAETDTAIDTASNQLRAALTSSEIVVDPTSRTFEGVQSSAPALGVAPMNQVVVEAKKCEALNSRDNCSALDDPKYANCGICVQSRETMFKNPNDKYKHGGLLVLPEDRRSAVAEHGSSPGPVQYSPTVGNCPPNYLFVDSASCKAAANRLDCAEAGQSGGFNKGRTSEGKDVIGTKCAAAPIAGNDVFVYDPKNRSFDVNLRVLTPSGTGITQVTILDKASGRQLGYASNEKPGVAFTVTAKNVTEGQSVNVVVVQEVPHRNKGKAEVFQYAVNTQSRNAPSYNQTAATSTNVCQRIGARIATDAELQQAYADGAQLCSCGNTATSNKFPGQATLGGCGGPGLNDCGTNPNAWNGGMGHSWCYGVKPPQTTDQQFYNTVSNWFSTFGKNSSPSQEDRPSQWSKWGPDYQATARRAVIMQWEHVTDSGRMAQPFEPSITAVNDQGPSTVTSDGLKSFKILRRFGTYKSSSIILSPRPVQGSPIVTSQFWIWGNLENSQSVKFTAQIPGTFMTPAYDVDGAVVRRGQLITNPDTFKLLQISPCLKDGQVAGKYSLACLSNLYQGSGGDPTNGVIAKNGMVNPYNGSTGNGLNDLNKLGDMDAISAYLDNQFSIATTGVDSNGDIVGGNDRKAHADAINLAAQLMFGFDITTPCEDVQQDKQGNIVIVPKTGNLDSFCLQWLWQNTGSDKDRYQEDGTRFAPPHKGGIRNTYTTINDRYSGLRNGEATIKQRAAAPFQACQPRGSAAPVDANGKPNAHNIALANSKGDIDKVQAWYDSLHKSANYSGGSKDVDAMSKHADAVVQCYGLSKASNKPQPDCNALPKSYTPTQGSVIGQTDMTGDYTLSFTITPKGYVGNWANIVRFQNAPGGQGDCCGFGQRSPAIWFFPGALSLHVRIGDSWDGNWGINTDPIPMGYPSNVTVECKGRSVRVIVNGRIYADTQPSRRYAGKMTVYGSDPWYPAANADITNFKYAADTINSKVLTTIGSGPWGGCGTFKDRTAKWIWDDQNAASNAEVNKEIFFTKVINLPSPAQAVIHVIADDAGEVYINDVSKGSIAGGGWGGNYTKLNVNLSSGNNTIKIMAKNYGGPAGLVASIINSDGAVIANTDQTWTVSY